MQSRYKDRLAIKITLLTVPTVELLAKLFCDKEIKTNTISL